MKVLIQTIVASLLSFAMTTVMATAQQSDEILIDGRFESLNTNPLRTFLIKNPNSLPESDSHTSSNWRGYVATWVIDGRLLYLTRVVVNLRRSSLSEEEQRGIDAVVGIDFSERIDQRNVLGKMFPGRERVVADWYSGALIVPHGEVIDYVHMGYGSTYASYTVLLIKRGVVSSRKDLSSEEFLRFRSAQFDKFKATPEYAQLLKSAISGGAGLKPQEAENFLYEFESENYLSDAS